MTEKEFCSLYSSFYGERLDKVDQLKLIALSGKELFEFYKFIQLYNGNEETIYDLRNEVYRLEKDIKDQDLQIGKLTRNYRLLYHKYNQKHLIRYSPPPNDLLQVKERGFFDFETTAFIVLSTILVIGVIYFLSKIY